MAESDLSRTSYRGIPRGEVRNTTPIDLDAPIRVERSDPISYGPLDNPNAPDHGYSPPSPEPQAPPTEEALREALGRSITSRDFATQNVDRAHETHQRAVLHVADCRERLEDFADLDAEIAEATIEALRSGNGRPRIDDNDLLRHRLGAREIAKADLQGAEHALAVLFDGLTDAQTDAATATKAASDAAAKLTMLLAETLAARALALEAEAQQLREELHGADVIGIPPPASLRKIFGDGSRFLRPVDRSAWAALRERLLTDPQSALELV